MKEFTTEQELLELSQRDKPIEIQDCDIIEYCDEEITEVFIPIIVNTFEEDIAELCELTRKGLRNKKDNKIEILTTKEWYENCLNKG